MSLIDGYKNFIDLYLVDILTVLAPLLCGAIVCAIIGIPFFFFQRQRREHLRLEREGHTVGGTVTGLYTRRHRMRGDENTPSYTIESPHAVYSFVAADGHTYTGDFAQKRKSMYGRGDSVTVYYDPQNPQSNCTPRQLEEDVATRRLFLSLFALVAVLCAAMALWLGLS